MYIVWYTSKTLFLTMMTHRLGNKDSPAPNAYQQVSIDCKLLHRSQIKPNSPAFTMSQKIKLPYIPNISKKTDGNISHTTCAHQSKLYKYKYTLYK